MKRATRKAVRASFHLATDSPAKQASLAAALTLFARNGIDATTIRDIADKSGFTNPAIFKHFDTKEALALCLFERCYRWIADAFLDADDENADARTRILAAGDCALRLMDEDIEAVLCVQENLRRFWRDLKPDTRSLSLLGHMRRLIAGGVSEGSVSPAVSANILASAILGFLGQIAREYYFGEIPGAATAQSPAVRAIILRILNAEPAQTKMQMKSSPRR
jgi:TetR/AcrR family transcriptional regulator, repressor of fatR-cypB operon